MVRDSQQDLLFDCLAHHHRRVIIDILQNANSPKSTTELARDVVEEIRETSLKEVSSFEHMRNSLYHVHLPRLKEAGLVEYDEKRGTVAPTVCTSHSGVLVDIADVIAGAGRQANVAAGDRDEQVQDTKRESRM